MMKKCYVLNDQIINIGDWDYQKYIDEKGNEVIGNPLPKGAVEVEKDMEYNEDRGWYEVGTQPTKDEVEILKERLEFAEMALIQIMMEG